MFYRRICDLFWRGRKIRLQHSLLVSGSGRFVLGKLKGYDVRIGMLIWYIRGLFLIFGSDFGVTAGNK